MLKAGESDIQSFRVQKRQSDQSIKICFVSHSAGMGGAERSLLETLDSLKKRGVQSHVILPKAGPLIDELEYRDVNYSIIPYRWWTGKGSPLWIRIGRIVWNVLFLLGVTSQIKRCKCDIVYTNTITVCVGAISAKLLGKPHVWHIREFGYEDHGLSYDLGQKFSLSLINRLSKICIANSHAIAHVYRQYISPSKLKVIYQPVVIMDQTLTDGTILPQFSERSGIKCIILGSLREGKKQDDAIRAVNELVHSGIEAELLIVGDGDIEYREYLRNMVEEYQLHNHVRFVGYVNNPIVLIKSADVLLMCSRGEAFGRVTVEAMKAERPVIGARTGGTQELIRDGFNGFLYTVGNHIELAEKIKHLYDDPELARHMGKKGLDWALAQFNEQRFGSELISILKQLV